MDQYSSGEDVVIKTRKPYTITKQRERWTEEEHNRFLEALKLYGRAWQRIEEYIGTKTAVQIRSHAQKFFSKLEKEALVKGVAISQALDIDIPPPRPKRKPNNPYPRKIGAIAPTLQAAAKDEKVITAVSSSCSGKRQLDLEKEPLAEKSGGEEKSTNSKEYQDDSGSDVFNHFQEAACTSLSSPNENSKSSTMPHRYSYKIRESVPSAKEVIQQDGTNGSYVTDGSKCNQNLDRPDSKQKLLEKSTNINSANSRPSHGKSIQSEKILEPAYPRSSAAQPTDEMQSTQNYPRHVPVHILDGSQGTSYSYSPDNSSYQESVFDHLRGIYGLPHLFAHLPASATDIPSSSFHQLFPNLYDPSAPRPNSEDDCRSFLQLSSAFSGLLLSTLLQNPAAHAAASFTAATFWASANVEASGDSLGGFSSTKVSQGAPSMVAIAAATVAAATAWWAANGLLPLCAPFPTHNGFTCPPSSTNAAPSTAANTGKRENILQDPTLQHQQVEPECYEASEPQHSASKSRILSSAGPEESGEVAKLDCKVGLSKANDHDKATVAVMELNDSDKLTNGRKLVDRSSCGSNSTSSSEMETDVLKKHEKGKEESMELDASQPDADHSIGESINRRGRCITNNNDSWKEVSEEGRLAFQALFSQEVLPQSFTTRDMKNDGNHKGYKEEKQKVDDRGEHSSGLDLNSNILGPCPSHQGVENNVLMRSNNDVEEGTLTIGLGNGKLKARRTGFKPYKRCSVEAKERMSNGSSQCEEKGPKRIRLEEEALV